MKVEATKRLTPGSWVVDDDGRACQVRSVTQTKILFGDKAGEDIPGYMDVEVWYPNEDETFVHTDDQNANWEIVEEFELDYFGVTLPAAS